MLSIMYTRPDYNTQNILYHLFLRSSPNNNREEVGDGVLDLPSLSGKTAMSCYS